MTLFIAVLPLRLPSTRHSFGAMLGQYMDSDSSVEVQSMDCRQDLQRMDQLKQDVAANLVQKDGYEEAMIGIEDLHEYYNCLLECEAKGILGNTTTPTTPNSIIQLEWESALSGQIQVQGSLPWERANIIWNLAALEAYQASKQKLDSKGGWSKAAQHLQNAASWLQYIPPEAAATEDDDEDEACVDFSDTLLLFWQTLLIAQSQRCVYESLACAPRPRHLLLSKLAAAAVPLFGEMEAVVRKDEESTHPLLGQFSSLTNNMADFCRAWGMFMSCKAEHHQAILSKEKKHWGQELARLDMAHQFATLCCEYCERAPLISLQQLHTTVDGTVAELKERIDQAEQENIETHQKQVPARHELTEIRGEKLVNIDQPLKKLLKAMKGEPMFQGVTDTQHLRQYMELFHSEMDKLIFQLSNVSEERTDSARKALATVNLPHSLTAYRQEQAGGGIPDDLWQRVQSIQRERRMAKLKQDLWELRDVAEVARTTYQRIASQLDFDLESDDLFRQDNPTFEGHDAQEAQKSFRQSLTNYDRLLVTAQEGDSVLLNRLEGLDTNPKYKLLQFQKSQLDRLLPGSAGNGTPTIDTSHLSRLLVDLSGLFHERDVLLNTMKDEVKNYDITGVLQTRGGSGSDMEYRDAVVYSEKAFDGIVYELQNNLERQTDLVNDILQENGQFMAARERTNNSQSADSCIVMIEDAIEEIDQLSKHLKEGRDFYDVVIPKLEKLKHQVGDVSARLTVERLEFNDKATRSRQEQEDADFAKRMSTTASSSGGGGGNGPSPSPQGAMTHNQPGMSQVSHNRTPQVFVDDEKVATLVAMEFDPTKVVAALTKYNNNVDQALNELLSC